MSHIEWLDGNKIKIVPPKKSKKLTGTRFATIFGLNPWETPFGVFCAITRTYEAPFEDTIYTAAGKIIEPKQAAYMKELYFMDDLVTPSDLYGKDYFKKTRGDFFPDVQVLGGMFDYLRMRDEKPTTVLEMKTTKRAEDWAEDIPEYYALQAALYAYLLHVDNVIMVASFLDEDDYNEPENYNCNVHNTITRPFKLSERYPNFETDYIEPALKWWRDHVESGISPEFDEKRDAEILKVLRTNTLNPETDLSALVDEAEDLKSKLDAHSAEVANEEKRYKKVTELIKQAAVEQFREGDKKVTITGRRFTWDVSRSATTKINKDALKEDGLLEKYSTTEDTYRLTSSVIKGG